MNKLILGQTIFMGYNTLVLVSLQVLPKLCQSLQVEFFPFQKKDISESL